MLSQKSTVLCILDILKRFSDEYHPISADKIIEKLRVIYDISMERRAVYRNISVLNEMGIEVVKYSDNRGGYCLLEHDFEPIEIRMLCDALTSSHLMSEKQNKKLISKLLSTLSVYQANEIKSTVYINSKQTINTSIIFYNLEVLNSAVSQCKCISFDFMKYNLNKELERRMELLMSPYYTVCAENKYYLIGRNERNDRIIHLPIEKIRNILMTDIEYTPNDYGFIVSDYVKEKITNNGEPMHTTDIECDSNEIDALIDVFGENVTFTRQNEKINARIRATDSEVLRWTAQRKYIKLETASNIL